MYHHVIPLIMQTLLFSFTDIIQPLKAIATSHQFTTSLPIEYPIMKKPEVESHLFHFAHNLLCFFVVYFISIIFIDRTWAFFLSIDSSALICCEFFVEIFFLVTGNKSERHMGVCESKSKCSFGQ